MKRTSLFTALFAALLLTGSAFPQAAATAPAAAAPAASAPAANTKIGIIALQDAIFGTNEGQRDTEVMQKEMEPERAALLAKQKEIEDIQNQLKTGGDKLSDETRNSLVSQGQEKKTAFDRASEDFNRKAQKKLGDIYARIGQKFAPVMQKYANDHGFSVVFDGSNQQAPLPVVFYAEWVDITKAVLDAYNAQSGVVAPARPASARPAGAGAGATRPAGSAVKPATTPAKPATTTPH